MPSNHFLVGKWKVEPSIRRISNAGQSVTLEPQIMAVLACLASKEGEVVSKDELFDTVWSDVIVSENVLTRAISSLRKALNDDPSAPAYIETISKKGYRLIAPVTSPQLKSDKHIQFRFKRKPLVLTVTVLLLVVFGGFAMRKVLLPFPTESMWHPEIIVANDYPEYYPAISNDGQFVAFSARSKETNSWNIFAKRLGTENLVQLSDNSSSELRPVWSKNGAEVYFLRYESGEQIVYKVAMTGGTATRVLKLGQFNHGNFDISPNEQSIVSNNRLNRNSPLTIEITSLSDGETKQITTPATGFNGDIHPTYSPDGSKLAFIREKNSTSMYLHIHDLESGKLEQITTDHQSINGFDWSADGGSLVFGSDKTGIYKLWRANVNTGKSTLIPAGDYQMVMPRVAQSDKMIYARLQDNVNIWSMSMDTQEAKPWLSSMSLNLNPSISPDGDKLAFTTNKNGHFELWTSNTDGSEQIPLTKFSGQYVNSPRWSSDGKEIIFQGVINGQSDLFKINALGGIPENLTNTSFEESTPLFSSHDQSIYYSSNRSGNWEIWKINSNKSPEQVTRNGGFAPQISASGKEITYVKKDKLGLWKTDLESGTEVRMIDDFHPMYSGAFALSSQGIYYFNGNTKTIDFLNLETMENSALIRPKRIPRLGITMDFSEASNTLFFSQVDHIDSDIMGLVSQPIN